MSEEKPKIKIIQKTKDPKRVEARKRLTAISKQAKERKMRERIEEEKNVEQNDAKYDYTYIIGVSGLWVSLVCRYYTRKRFDLEEKEYKEEEQRNIPKQINNLDSFD